MIRGFSSVIVYNVSVSDRRLHVSCIEYRIIVFKCYRGIHGLCWESKNGMSCKSGTGNRTLLLSDSLILGLGGCQKNHVKITILSKILLYVIQGFSVIAYHVSVSDRRPHVLCIEYRIVAFSVIVAYMDCARKVKMKCHQNRTLLLSDSFILGLGNC